jgi:hypothetical protein
MKTGAVRSRNRAQPMATEMCARLRNLPAAGGAPELYIVPASDGGTIASFAGSLKLAARQRSIE